MAYNLQSFEVLEGVTAGPIPCQKFTVNLVITRDVSDPVLSGLNITSVTGNIRVSYYYPQDFEVVQETQSGNTITYELQLIKNKLQYSSFKIDAFTSPRVPVSFGVRQLPVRYFLSDVNVNISPQGSATVSPKLTINTDPSSRELEPFEVVFANIESSLDDITYRNNTITGVEDGNYTFYVRDKFGCEQSLEFTVSGAVQQVEPFIFASILNPVYLAKVNGQKTNNENTLSYQNQTSTNYKNWTNKLLNTDVLRFQYQSSYATNKAFAITETELIELPVTKVSDNRSVDIRDGFVTFIQGLPMQIYYPSEGNVYDEEGNVIGVNTLNGGVLSYNTIGSFIDVEDVGTLRINDFRQDPNLGTLMIMSYSGSSNIIGTKKITTRFQDIPFEYYEFLFSFNDLGCYQIAICDSNSFDENNPLESVKYLSERIEVVKEINESHTIEWFNDVNNQIAWSTGIKGKIYVPYIMPETFEPEDENEVYTTDTRQALIESDSFENFVFHFDSMPLNIARQLNLLLNSSYVNIDGINYIKKEAAEIDPQFGSNLYVVNAKMSKVSNYNSNSNEGQDISGEPSTTVDPSKGILKLN